MRAAVLLLLILLAPALAGTVMPVAQEPLAADLNNAIELWSGFIQFIKTGTSTNYYKTLSLSASDLEIVRGWDGGYIVLKVTNLDSFKGNPPRIWVEVKPVGWEGSSSLYKTERVPVTVGMNSFYIPKYIWDNPVLDDGANIYIIMDIGWAPDTTDPSYGVKITKIYLAPPEGTQDNTQADVTRMSDMYVLSGREMALALAGAGALALALTIMVLAGRRR